MSLKLLSIIVLAAAFFVVSFAPPSQSSSKPASKPAPESAADEVVIIAARPNPYNRGNCFQWKKCLGETIGNMWIETPEYCGPLGGKSWKGPDGRCIDLVNVPWSVSPESIGEPQ
ncbi:MAG: hypothetical protein LBT62_05240 [Deltaproteobacteria bacterium]|jgi:hypothetical protein|nr:hypothetical protein [Deltaproteobacteria bacterium]